MEARTGVVIDQGAAHRVSTAVRRDRLSPRLRRLVLIVHIAAAGTWIGLDAAFAVLAYTALLSDDAETAGAAFQMLAVVAVWPMLSVAAVNLGSGMVLGLGSKYGLLRYWWVIVKLSINLIFATLILVALRPELGRLAAAGRQLTRHQTATVPIGILPYPLTVGPLLLLTAVALSVTKPWGKVRRPLGPAAVRRLGLPLVIGGLTGIVVMFAARRLLIDVPNLTAGTLPENPYDWRYVQHPWLAYLHIAPGLVYLLAAPLQLAYRIRSRHYDFHRRLGRVLLALGLASGGLAIAFGALHAFGGVAEAVASVVFGGWFVLCLGFAFRAIRGGVVAAHRRWMVRAFAVALGVGTVRIWIGLLDATGLVRFETSFGIAFWLAFCSHVVAAECWLRARPLPPEDRDGR